MRNKLVLVTGASSGIGKVTAERFAQQGARVILLARSSDKLEKAAVRIKVAGGDAVFYRIDLSQAEEIEAISDRIKAEQGIPDIIAYLAYPIAKTKPPYGDIYHDHVSVIVTTVVEYEETVGRCRSEWGGDACHDADPIAVTLGRCLWR